MVEPVEDKDFVAERLDQDRQKMAVQVGELKEQYNFGRRLRASVQSYPWRWMIGGVMTGFLLALLPARRREIYLWAEPLQRRPPREIHPPRAEKDDSPRTNKLWSMVKPIVSAYIGRELYKRMRRPSECAAEAPR
ncbi:MAG TPA: hypothetical protein VE641_18225 [Chthoniobacterales bacterium]|nr:hypothetical protein [Chthoniobacterales bacterium]